MTDSAPAGHVLMAAETPSFQPPSWALPGLERATPTLIRHHIKTLFTITYIDNKQYFLIDIHSPIWDNCLTHRCSPHRCISPLLTITDKEKPLR